MKLTDAQVRYLGKAIHAGATTSPWGGWYFSLWTPGNTLTGRALLRRGLITPIGDHHFAFQVTEAGLRAYMDISWERREAVCK